MRIKSGLSLIESALYPTDKRTAIRNVKKRKKSVQTRDPYRMQLRLIVSVVSLCQSQRIFVTERRVGITGGCSFLQMCSGSPILPSGIKTINKKPSLQHPPAPSLSCGRDPLPAGLPPPLLIPSSKIHPGSDAHLYPSAQRPNSSEHALSPHLTSSPRPTRSASRLCNSLH